MEKIFEEEQLVLIPLTNLIIIQMFKEREVLIGVEN